MAQATRTAPPTVFIPHHIIDTHVSEGPLHRELLDCYQSLHRSRRRWPDKERGAIRIKLELRHPRQSPTARYDDRHTELRIYAEHHGCGCSYTEGTPFLVAGGFWLRRSRLARKLPALGRFYRREARILQAIAMAA